MGFVNSIFGGKSGNQGGAGLNFNASQAGIINPFANDQVNAANGQATSAVNQQQAFVNALQAGGNQGMANQQQLADMLMAQANGGGPNPAQAQFQNNVNQNAAMQAGAIASAKGISPALQARLIASQGAAAQQNAAGQAAALQAQQQLSAQNALGNLAGQQVAQQQQGLTGLNQFSQGNQQNLMGALQGYNQAAVGSQSSVNSANAGISAQAAQQQGNLFSNMMDKAGSALSKIKFADGGEVPDCKGPVSGAGKYFKAGGMVPGKAAVPGDSAANDIVDAKLSPKEIVLPRSVTLAPDAPERAKAFVQAIMAKKGKV